MANGDKGFLPQLSASAWWTLRRRFKSALPTKIDKAYLATVLNVKESSAGVYLPKLRLIGLIDDECKPTELANRWRDDGEYPKVCEEILDRVAPEGLRQAAPKGAATNDSVVRWITLQRGVGASAAKSMASFYLLLQDADPEGESKSLDSSSSKSSNRKPASTSPKKTSNSSPKAQNPAKSGRHAAESNDKLKVSRELAINIQIHISADASDQQIESIFKHMGDYLR